MNKIKSIIFSQNIDEALSHDGYEISIDYVSGLNMIFHGSKLTYDHNFIGYYHSNDIKSAILECDELIIDTTIGRIFLNDIKNIKIKKAKHESEIKDKNR